MAKFPINSIFSLSRAYTVAAENAKIKSPAVSSIIRKMGDSTGKETIEEKGKEIVFWMRDPKTGNWLPENHIGEVDVAELREKLLSKNRNLS